MSSKTAQPVLWIPESIQSSLCSIGDRHHPLETGGIILGYVSGGSYVVTAVTGPGPNAAHLRTKYTPDYGHDQAAIIEHFDRTGGKDTYLGDWHTHPDGGAGVSFLDRRTLRRIAENTGNLTVLPIMMIVSGATLGWNISAYQHNPREGFLHLLGNPVVMRVRSCADQQVVSASKTEWVI